MSSGTKRFLAEVGREGREANFALLDYSLKQAKIFSCRLGALGLDVSDVISELSILISSVETVWADACPLCECGNANNGCPNGLCQECESDALDAYDEDEIKGSNS